MIVKTGTYLDLLLMIVMVAATYYYYEKTKVRHGSIRGTALQQPRVHDADRVGLPQIHHHPLCRIRSPPDSAFALPDGEHSTDRRNRPRRLRIRRKTRDVSPRRHEVLWTWSLNLDSRGNRKLRRGGGGFKPEYWNILQRLPHQS